MVYHPGIERGAGQSESESFCASLFERPMALLSR
jgi:hypothetical protein